MPPRWSRRRFLRCGSLVGASGFAGCATTPWSGSRCQEGRTVHESDVVLAGSAAWPMFQFDAANTGHNPDASGPKDGVETAWRYSDCTFVEAGPVIDDGRVCSGGLVVDGRTGKRVSGEWSGHASTAAFADGTLYASSFDLEARDAASGERRWTFQTDVDAGALPAPTVAGSTVYVPGSIQDDTLYAVDAAAGTERWRFATDGDVLGPLAVVDGEVFAVDKSSTIYSIDASTGEERWRATFDADLWRTSPVVVDGVIYLGSWEGEVLAVGIDERSELWRTAIDAPDFRIGGPVAVADDTVFAAGREGLLVALDANGGRIEWRARTGLYELGTPAIADGVVYVGAAPLGNSGTVFAFDAGDGTTRWEFETREQPTGEGGVRSGINGSPAVVDDLVYVATVAGDLYALAGR